MMLKSQKVGHYHATLTRLFGLRTSCQSTWFLTNVLCNQSTSIPYKCKLINIITILFFYTSEVSIFPDGHVCALYRRSLNTALITLLFLRPVINQRSNSSTRRVANCQGDVEHLFLFIDRWVGLRLIFPGCHIYLLIKVRLLYGLKYFNVIMP